MKMLRCMCDVTNIDWMKSCMKLKKERVDTRDGVVYSGQVRDRRLNYTNVTTIYFSLHRCVQVIWITTNLLVKLSTINKLWKVLIGVSRRHFQKISEISKDF